MRAYRDGTLAVSATNNVVIGTGTQFVANVSIGDIILLQSGVALEIIEVTDNTTLKVDTVSAAAASGLQYVALKFVTPLQYRNLSMKIEQFLTDRQVNLTEFAAWTTGTATGGPNNDGRYPLTDRFGNTILADSPTKMMSVAGSPNVKGLAAAISGANLSVYFTNNQGAMATYLVTQTARELAGQNSKALMREYLELVKTTSAIDETNGRVWTNTSNGMFGLGGLAVPKVTLAAAETQRASELFTVGGGASPVSSLPIAGLHIKYSEPYAVEFFGAVTVSRYFARTLNNGNWQAPVELLHTGNSLPLGITPALAREVLEIPQGVVIASTFADFNAGPYIVTGQYTLPALADTGFSNRPLDAGGTLSRAYLRVYSTGGYITQQLSLNNNRMFSRSFSGSIWTAWVEDWNTSNLEKTAGAVDFTTGRVATVGFAGWGGAAPSKPGALASQPSSLYYDTSQEIFPVATPLINVSGSRSFAYAARAAQAWTYTYGQAPVLMEHWTDKNLNKQASAYTQQSGDVLLNGSFGLGSLPAPVNNINAVELAVNGFINASPTAAGNSFPTRLPLISVGYAEAERAQILMDPASETMRLRFRYSSVAGAWRPDRDVWHTGNLIKQAEPADNTPGKVLTTLGNIGPFGLGGYPVQRRSLAQINLDRGNEFFDSNLSTAENPFGAFGAGVHMTYPATNRWGQLFFKMGGVSGVSISARVALGGAPLAPVELWHSDNLKVGISGDAIGKLNTSNVWSGRQEIRMTGDGLRLVPDAGSNAAYVSIYAGDGGRSGYIGAGSSSSSDMYLTADVGSLRLTAANSAQWLVSTAAFYPGADNSFSLGISSRRPSVVYSATGAINTSDARMKTEVRPFTENELNCAIELSEEIGAFNFLDSVDEKGGFARDHIGMTVQRAIEIMESHGLEPYDYGFICYDQWPEMVDMVSQAEYETRVTEAVYENVDIKDPETGELVGQDVVEVSPRKEERVVIREEVVETRPAGERYSFREGELQSFIIRGMAEQSKRDRARMTSMESMLAALASKA